MRIDVLTLFPEVIEPFCAASIVGRAQRSGLVRIVCTNIRDFATDRHRTVDDKPFGGGAGMVLMPAPVYAAVEYVEAQEPTSTTRILLTPQGRVLNQALARELAVRERLLLICGHYEGVDERVRTGLRPLEISIGDYVLSGGEPAALVLMDAVVRLLPGALGGEQTLEQESFTDGLLEYPQYTRPRVFRGLAAPEVLVSGHHEKVARWRRAEALKRTWRQRPDLIQADARLLDELRQVLAEEGTAEADLPDAPTGAPARTDTTDS